MSPFNGLYGYESLLLILGVLLFLAVLFAFVFQVLHYKKLGALAVYLTIAIVMIAYPSIQSVQYKDGLVTIAKYTEQLHDNPANNFAQQSLKRTVQQLAPRVHMGGPNATSLAVVASAQYALGEDAAAKINLKKAASANSNAEPVMQLQERIATVDRLKQLNSQLRSNPADHAISQQLSDALAKASRLKLANPNALLQLANAQLALGQQQAAAATTQKVLTIRPNLAEAIQLQAMIARSGG